MLDEQRLQMKVNEFIKQSELNYIHKEEAINESVIGLQMFDIPLLGFADVSDGLFQEMKKKEAVGPQFMTPQEWLPEGKTVVSFFLPFSETVRKSNREHNDIPSNEWLHGRIEGQRFVAAVGRFIKACLEEEGHQALIPSADTRFRVAMSCCDDEDPVWKGATYTSNWSERHVAYICGLGTFGLSKGLITKKGIAGRFGSVITDAVFPPTRREYTGIYEYCSMCGACVKRCPVHAITLEEGKKHSICHEFVSKTKETYIPRYGCGKCQTAVPCESQIPVTLKK